MKFRCPSCGFTGIIRVPDYFPRGKKVAINCVKCNKKFSLTTGKLWPQASEAAYRALIPETLDCKGEIFGNLWVEITGAKSDSPPLFVFPSDLAFPHEIMHDLVGPLSNYTHICYLEFPGTRRNPAADNGNGYFESFEMIMERLKATEFHILSHKTSCSLALSTAAHFGTEVCSALILIEPLIAESPLQRAAQNDPQLFTPLQNNSAGNALSVGSRKDILFAILSEYRTGELEEYHTRGIAGIMAPGLSVELLAGELKQPDNKLTYRKLSRIKAPALILTAAASTGEEAEGKAHQQAIDDILFIDSSIPQAEIQNAKKTGDWAYWFSVEYFAAAVSSFTQRVKKRKREAAHPRSRTISTLPVGWLTAASFLLIWGLTFLLHKATYVPDYMRRVVPVVVGALAPLASFLLPRKINLFQLQRFSNLKFSRTLLAAAAGIFLGISWAALLLIFKGALLFPSIIPSFLLSLPAGTEGRIFLFMAILLLQLLLFGVLENILIIRRSPVKILLPALLFSLMPFSFPDLIWQLPLGAASAFLMYRHLSIYSPLTLLLGFALSSELLLKYFNLTLPFFIIPAAAAVFFILFLSAVFLKPAARSSGGPLIRYYTTSLLRDNKHFPWRISRGIFISLLTLIASIILIVGFLRT